MALYMKQEFSPPILSKKWIAMKFRPNMLIYNRLHVISILESGLLFREDCIEVEQEVPCPEEMWAVAGGGRGGLTRGERVASVTALAAAVCVFRPKILNRSCFIYLAGYLSIPLLIRTGHRLCCQGSLVSLLDVMREYLTLARRAAACLKEITALRNQLVSVSSIIESSHTLLCRQQSDLSITMSRASSALLGNAPWLRSDVAWDALTNDTTTDNLMKIHHTFLVVQSTLLKHIAMAHYITSPRARKIYKNHNERVFWMHNVLIPHLTEDFKENLESLQRVYRLMKNIGNKDENSNKKLGSAVNSTWVFSDVHTGIAKTCLELKLALNKCNNLDTFLDSCAMNKQDFEVTVLNKDIDDLIDNITKCLNTAQASQIKLKKIHNKVMVNDDKINKGDDIGIEDDRVIIKIDNIPSEVKDEVFYSVKTDDDNEITQPVSDVSTEPGKKEIEATKTVLNELRRKLVRREDLMRERERQALKKTMPEFQNNVPEFPRQIDLEVLERKGFISKLPKKIPKKRLLKNYKIKPIKNKEVNKFMLVNKKFTKQQDIDTNLYEANSEMNMKSKLLSFNGSRNNSIIISKWNKVIQKPDDLESSGLSEGPSDVESTSTPITKAQSNHQNGDYNYKFNKKDLELTPSSSDSEGDQERIQLLQDMRRYRAMRKKNYPDRCGQTNAYVTTEQDESLRPIEYNLGTGLALAAILRARGAGSLREVEFAGEGGGEEGDSGHEEDD